MTFSFVAAASCRYIVPLKGHVPPERLVKHLNVFLHFSLVYGDFASYTDHCTILSITKEDKES